MPDDPNMNTNGWKTDAKLVLWRLGQIDNELTKIDNRLESIESKVWILQVKAAGIGGFVALVTSYIMGRL